jgi:hypothetical protein
MPEELKSDEKKDIADQIEREGDLAKSMAKLLTGGVEVSVYKYKLLIEETKRRLEDLRKAYEGLERTDDQLQILNKVEADLARYENDKIEGILTPLKYREIQLIKAGMAEAQLETRKMGYDLDVQILMALTEQRALTVYFALKKKDGVTRYFSSLEEIAALPDDVINELYDLYMEKIGLTPEERKK